MSKYDILKEKGDSHAYHKKHYHYLCLAILVVPDLERIGNPNIRLYGKQGCGQYYDCPSDPNIIYRSHKMVWAMTVVSPQWYSLKERRKR